MAHHFPKSTVEASIWCNKCCAMTQWRVADGRRQYCIPCYERPKPAAPTPATVDARQMDLFKAKE